MRPADGHNPASALKILEHRCPAHKFFGLLLADPTAHGGSRKRGYPVDIKIEAGKGKSMLGTVSPGMLAPKRFSDVLEDLQSSSDPRARDLYCQDCFYGTCATLSGVVAGYGPGEGESHLTHLHLSIPAVIFLSLHPLDQKMF